MGTQLTELEDVAMRDLRALFSSCSDKLDYLSARWLDEREYEDFDEYEKVLRSMVTNPRITFVKASKRPFGFVVRHADINRCQFRFYASGSRVGFKPERC